MSCYNCNCPSCKGSREREQQERYRAWDNLPACPACDGTGKVEDVCGYHVALVTCSPCGGTGKRGQGRNW